jgi:hypothetical protein
MASFADRGLQRAWCHREVGLQQSLAVRICADRLWLPRDHSGDLSARPSFCKPRRRPNCLAANCSAVLRDCRSARSYVRPLVHSAPAAPRRQIKLRPQGCRQGGGSGPTLLPNKVIWPASPFGRRLHYGAKVPVHLFFTHARAAGAGTCSRMRGAFFSRWTRQPSARSVWRAGSQRGHATKLDGPRARGRRAY